MGVVKSLIVNIFGICVFSNTICFTSQLNVNEVCKMNNSNQLGICRLVDDCSDITKSVRKPDFYPTLCGFQEKEEIICCSEKNIVVTHTPADTPLANRTFFKKCIEYQNACPSKLTPFIDGEDAAPKEFPHMALIGYDDNEKSDKIVWLCGGSLISENFVLTAAICISSYSGEPKYVRLGDLDYGTDEDDAQPRQFKVIENFVHPLFNRKTYYHNIGLVKVDGRIEFNEFIRPACLAEVNTVIAKKVVATGWGATSFMREDRQTTHLQRVQLNQVSNTECFAVYEKLKSRKLPRGIVNKTQLCAGSRVGERDTCQGFSGGPLLNTDHLFSCLYEIVGITSFGTSCRNDDQGVYNLVSPYISWIENIVWLDTTEVL